jgi:predicted small secreted protein
MRKLVFASVLALLPILAACNTIAGIGKDVSTVGGALEDAAKDAKK